MEMSMKSFKIRYLNKSVRMCYTKNTFFLLHRCRPNVKVSVHLCQYVPIRVYIGEIPQQLFSFRRSRGLPKTVLPDFLGNTIFTGASRFLHSFQSVIIQYRSPNSALYTTSVIPPSLVHRGPRAASFRKLLAARPSSVSSAVILFSVAYNWTSH